MRRGRCGREMQTDFPYIFSVYGCSRSQEQSDKYATIHIVHRKTENKSHVRAHNVLQTSLHYLFFGKKNVFFFSSTLFAHVMLPKIRFVVLHLSKVERKKNGEKRNDFL